MKRVLFVVLGMVSFLMGTMPVHAAQPQNTAVVAAVEDEDTALCKEALTLVNQQRAAVGLPALTWSEDLLQAAEIRAEECAQKFSHTRPDGTDWWTVDSKNVYGENLAFGYTTANAVVNGWMTSPAHQANELGDFTTCAIAIYRVNGTPYYAQEFGY